MDIKEAEQLYKEDTEKIAEMTFLDDVMMRVAFRNDLPYTQFVMRILMQKQDLVLTEVRTQYDLKRLRGRSLTLDVLGEVSDGTKINAEVQNDNRGASPKRARLHSSALDNEFIDVGDEPDDLPDTYVIFLTQHDVFGEGKLIYPVDRKFSDTNKLFNDGEHIVYINCAYPNADSDLAKLAHDFRCKNPDEMYFKEMADKMRYCKHTEEGVSAMRNISEEIREDTRKQDALKFALKLLKSGKVDLNFIAEMSELSVDEVKALAVRYDVSIPA